MANSTLYEDNTSPIEVVARKLVCENSKFYIYFDHLHDPGGEEIENYLVVSPKNTGKDLVTGVAILPICENSVGLIRIYRPAIRSYSWEIPHGFVDEGESDYSSAIRELLEETGLNFTGQSISCLGYITPDSGVLAARVHMFLADAPHTKSVIKNELGLRGFCFFSFQEFETMILSSEIQDTFTLAAWCKYKLMVSSGKLNE
jgi:8-oxo-dGTP pyrophosphatase MutT (NUDIX family)